MHVLVDGMKHARAGRRMARREVVRGQGGPEFDARTLNPGWASK
jgi:hypothetical protein